MPTGSPRRALLGRRWCCTEHLPCLLTDRRQRADSFRRAGIPAGKMRVACNGIVPHWS